MWNKWKGKKNDYENIVQWWEVGKTQIRMFCQNYTAHTNSLVKKTIRELERDIEQLETNAANNNLADVNMLEKRKKSSGTLLHETEKGALIRARFSLLKDMDAPFVFNLEKKEMERKQILHLKCINGSLTSDPKEMRMIAMDFYKE